MKFRALAFGQNEGRLKYQLLDLVTVVIWPLFNTKVWPLGMSHLTQDFSEELYLVATAWLEPGNHGFKIFTSCSLLSNSTIQCLLPLSGKLSSSATGEPSGVAQGIPTTANDDSIVSLDEEDPLQTGMRAFHASTSMDHEEMFKG